MSVKKLFDIQGKVALITGGSRGLGLQMAEALGEMGCRLAITARKEAELAKAREHLEAQGIEVLTIPGNMAQFDTIPALVDQVLERYGTIDILVNNAGATWGAPAEDYPDEAWHKVMDLNINAVFYLCREVGRRVMIPKRQGKIINIASAAGLRGTAKGVTTIAYNTSKAAAVNFSRTLASEWGRYNINVNAVCPGFFESRMTAGTLDTMGQTLLDKIPLGRIGGEEDLKGLTVFLASEASRHITGQAISVDGGASAAA
ncbi:SDR family oxidoreductase [Achromobacter sp. F4_2707]|uniref:SDR family oxidoreductase n=1 Tax=Achromobacter sp. F4_2707 TaxID=3114286 RepID=UPI0039C6624B